MLEDKIQGLIFDLDGTLYHLKYMKLRMTLLLWTSVKHLRLLFESRAAVREHTHAGQGALLQALYKDLAGRTGSTTAKTEDWYQNSFMPAFIKLLGRSAGARSGLIELLESLKAKGIKLAVVSDFSHVGERLAALGIRPEIFDALHCSEEYGVLKPSPLPMLAVATEWGLPPQNIAVVGDRDDMDGECARSAGMQFIGICDEKKTITDFYRWNDALTQIKARTNLE